MLLQQQQQQYKNTNNDCFLISDWLWVESRNSRLIHVNEATDTDSAAARYRSSIANKHINNKALSRLIVRTLKCMQRHCKHIQTHACAQESQIDTRIYTTNSTCKRFTFVIWVALFVCVASELSLLFRSLPFEAKTCAKLKSNMGRAHKRAREKTRVHKRER